MPASWYKEKLSHVEILEMLDSGRYAVDLDTGIVYSGRTKNPLFTYVGSEGGYLYIRVYKCPKLRALPVAHMVWIAGTRSPIPPGWEVHHDDEVVTHNWFDNLICVHPVDHKKIHRSSKSEVPF